MRKLLKLMVFVMVLSLGLSVVAGSADTMYVRTDDGSDLSLRDTATNEIIGRIPVGTALQPDPYKSTDLYAYVTYEGQSGYVLWRYLSFQDPAAGTTEPEPEPAPEPAAQPETGTSLNQNGYAVSVTGGTVTGDGETLTVNAEIPEGKQVAYWVFNGVRYDFLEDVSSVRVEKADRAWDIEIVYTDSDAKTLLTPEEIQAMRTGETLVVRGVKAELSHVDAAGNPANDWRKQFTFTKDYQNQKTRYKEPGGQISVRIRAVVPWDQFVIGWKFDETEFYPDASIRQLVVRSLNTPMTYEPILGTDPDAELPKVTVRCINCTFTGGGYTGATYGEVPIGTQIHAESVYDCTWRVNGSVVLTGADWLYEGYTLDRKIVQNTVIEAYMIIN